MVVKAGYDAIMYLVLMTTYWITTVIALLLSKVINMETLQNELGTTKTAHMHLYNVSMEP